MKNEQKSIGFGFALLGTSNTNYISDEEAENIFQCIIDHGILRFDTAPLYGGGLSEERLGKLLIKIPRNNYILSTKVGRYRPYASHISNPKNNPEDWYDFSSETTKRSVEKSLNRLGTDFLDIVFIHDCDNHIEEAVNTCLPILQDLKSQGVLGSIGCGSNVAETHEKILKFAEFDILMLEGRFTLLDQSALGSLFSYTMSKSVDVELASPFNSGILATGSEKKNSRFDYMPVGTNVLKRVSEIEKICSKFDVSLKRAALTYSLSHPAVKRLILGLVHPTGLASNITDLSKPPPNELWEALSIIGIPNPNMQEISQ